MGVPVQGAAEEDQGSLNILLVREPILDAIAPGKDELLHQTEVPLQVILIDLRINMEINRSST